MLTLTPTLTQHPPLTLPLTDPPLHIHQFRFVYRHIFFFIEEPETHNDKPWENTTLFHLRPSETHPDVRSDLRHRQQFFSNGSFFGGWPDDWLADWIQWYPPLTPPLPAQTSGKLMSNSRISRMYSQLTPPVYLHVLCNCTSLCNQWFIRLLNFSLCCIPLITEQSTISGFIVILQTRKCLFSLQLSRFS